MNTQSETIRYFVQYQDGKVLGFQLGEYVPASRWYEGQSFETSEEANRWAASRSKNKQVWRLIQVDIEAGEEPQFTRYVTPSEVKFWDDQQEQRWPDEDTAFNPGVRDFLAKLGADEAVIEFIEAAAPENQGKLANTVRKFPQITVDELEKWSEENLKTKREPDRPEENFATIFAENCTSDEVDQSDKYRAAYTWMLVHLMKLRTGKKLTDKTWGLMHEHHWNDPSDFEPARLFKFYSPRDNIIFTNVFFHHVPDWVRETNPELYSFDLYSARAASDEWHAQCSLAGTGENYEKTKPRNIVFKYPDGWTIQNIDSEHDLEVEGNRMGHCVGSYWDEVRKGSSQILSLRDESNEPHVTVEIGIYPNVVTTMVEQIQGKSDSEPIDEYKERLREWFVTMPDVRWRGGGDDWRLDQYGDLDDAARKIDELITSDGRDAYGIMVSKPDFSDVYDQAYRMAEDQVKHTRSGGWNGHDITDALAAYAVEYDKENPKEVEKFLEEKEQEGLEETNGWDYYDGFDEKYFKRDHPEPDPEDYENGEEDDAFVQDVQKWEEELQNARDEYEQEARDEEIKTFLPYAFPADVFTEFYKIKERQKGKK